MTRGFTGRTGWLVLLAGTAMVVVLAAAPTLTRSGDLAFYPDWAMVALALLGLAVLLSAHVRCAVLGGHEPVHETRAIRMDDGRVLVYQSRPFCARCGSLVEG